MASLVCIAVVCGDDLPGEDGLQEVEVVGEAGEEGAAQVAARVAVAAGPTEVGISWSGRLLRETVHLTFASAAREPWVTVQQ